MGLSRLCVQHTEKLQKKNYSEFQFWETSNGNSETLKSTLKTLKIYWRNQNGETFLLC